ncbi:hypothetical protein BCR44DRAFT_42119 [Catenaria anguillulae PL171]|uniref:Uncharacterized protein n=1 Tax=Catenaria anguillulae PL171 TaxID=765915 RepID=A0A1Y2HBC6_9FUNG|nr:hypothetical protein BCR44DRAFT_42119 [Catenaria anguillulae PL171]
MSLDQWMRKGQQNVIIEIGDTFIDSISGHGCLSVLNWWRDFGVVGQSQLEYTHRAIDSASEAGHLRILKWWQSSFPAKDLKYSELAMDKAASPAVLDWWLHESNLPLKFSSFATTHAARTNSRVNLDWWLAHTDQLGFQFLPTTLHDTMDRIIQGSARRGSRDDLANWVTMTWFAKHWRETGQVISQGFLLRASMDPNKAWFLEWWSEQGLPVERVVPEAIKYASTKQWSAIVSWWNKQVNEMRDRKTVGNEEATEKHPAVVRHERECMQMLQAMLEGMDPAAVPVP